MLKTILAFTCLLFSLHVGAQHHIAPALYTKKIVKLNGSFEVLELRSDSSFVYSLEYDWAGLKDSGVYHFSNNKLQLIFLHDKVIATKFIELNYLAHRKHFNSDYLFICRDCEARNPGYFYYPADEPALFNKKE